MMIPPLPPGFVQLTKLANFVPYMVMATRRAFFAGKRQKSWPQIALSQNRASS